MGNFSVAHFKYNFWLIDFIYGRSMLKWKPGLTFLLDLLENLISSRETELLFYCLKKDLRISTWYMPGADDKANKFSYPHLACESRNLFHNTSNSSPICGKSWMTHPWIFLHKFRERLLPVPNNQTGRSQSLSPLENIESFLFELSKLISLFFFFFF